jgi:hypothetical protein
MAYYQLEPFGEERADYRQAITSQILANVNLPKGKRPYDVEEFLVVKPVRQPKTAEQMMDMLKSLCKE